MKRNTSSYSERFDTNKESIIIGLKRLVAGELKYLFAKHTRRQGLLTGSWLMDPLLYYIFGLSFLALLFADATAERLKAIQDPPGERQGAL